MKVTTLSQKPEVFNDENALMLDLLAIPDSLFDDEVNALLELEGELHVDGVIFGNWLINFIEQHYQVISTQKFQSSLSKLPDLEDCGTSGWVFEFIQEHYRVLSSEKFQVCLDMLDFEFIIELMHTHYGLSGSRLKSLSDTQMQMCIKTLTLTVSEWGIDKLVDLEDLGTSDWVFQFIKEHLSEKFQVSLDKLDYAFIIELMHTHYGLSGSRLQRLSDTQMQMCIKTLSLSVSGWC